MTIAFVTRGRDGHLSPTIISSPALSAEALVVREAVELSRVLLFFPLSSVLETPQRRFERLRADWKEHTRFLSSTTAITADAAYLRIIGLGYEAVPLILRDLMKAPDHWFHALHAITGDDPVEPQHWGDMTAMTSAWLQWGRSRGLLV